MGDGTGQTIAIVDAFNNPSFVTSTDANFLTSDLHRFDVQFGLADPPIFIKSSQSGSTTTYPANNTGWGTEIALDVEWSHVMAPGACIVLVEATDNGGNLYTAVDFARNITGTHVQRVPQSAAGHGRLDELGRRRIERRYYRLTATSRRRAAMPA